LDLHLPGADNDACEAGPERWMDRLAVPVILSTWRWGLSCPAAPPHPPQPTAARRTGYKYITRDGAGVRTYPLAAWLLAGPRPPQQEKKTSRPPAVGRDARGTPRRGTSPALRCAALWVDSVNWPTLFSCDQIINKSTFFTWAMSCCRRYVFSLPRFRVNGWTGIF
jgi:hypothetical protein